MAVAGALLMALALRTCAEPLRVASPSMEPTVRMGDHVLVVKRPRGPLRRGEVVAFRAPPSWHASPDEAALWVKRVAALSGDTVRVRGDSVWVNGRMLPPPPDAPLRVVLAGTPPLDEVRRCDVVSASRREGGEVVAVADSAARRCLRRLSPLRPDALRAGERTDTALVVPTGTFFALGDYRAASRDSRQHGVVPVSGVVGRVAWVLVSFNEATRQRRPARTLRRVG